MTTPIILAHRGTNPYPDHSADAYTHAVDLGADFIEPDLQMTADGVLVSRHDADDVAEITYAELKAREPEILTFEEVIAIAQQKSLETGREIGIAYEVKDNKVATAEASIAALVAAGFTDPARVYVNAFDSSIVEDLTQRIMPEAGVDFPALLLGSASGMDFETVAGFADGVSLKSSGLTAQQVEAAQALGLDVHVWTQSGGVEQWLRFAALGVDAIYTDNTDIARTGNAGLADQSLVYGDETGAQVLGGAAADVIYAMQGDDGVFAGDGDDEVYGDGGDDLLAGGAGDDLLNGGAGDDALLGGKGANALDGGAGSDVIVSRGADLLVFQAGDGVDLVSVGGNDVLSFADLALADARITLADGHIAIEGASGDAVIVLNGASDVWGRPQAIQFADGALTGAQLLAAAQEAMTEAVAAEIPALIARAQAALAAEAEAEAPEQEGASSDNPLDQRIEVDGLLGANLIENGGFEDNRLTENYNRDWGWMVKATPGTPTQLVGWTDPEGNRLELHSDTVNGVRARSGAFYLDMDGYESDTTLIQQVQGVEAGATYKLSFALADTDTLEAGETIRVTWNGEIVWEQDVEEAAWRVIELQLDGDQGDGSGQLEFQHLSQELNLAGIALDDVKLQKVLAEGELPDLADGIETAPGHVLDLDGVQDGAGYLLSFDLAGAGGDAVQAIWNGEIVWEGEAADGVQIEVEGGAGDGADRLEFAGLDAQASLSDVSFTQTSDAVEREDLIVNGSFEDPAGTQNRSWGRYSPEGHLTGWDELRGGRLEIHSDPYDGISGYAGQNFLELDGVADSIMAQQVQGVEEGAVYRLRFALADADLATDDDRVVVTWNGETIYDDLPENRWEIHTFEVVGGAGDGADTLIFQQISEESNMYGAALDAVSMVKIADAVDETPETPALALIEGTTSRDALEGSDADEIIRGLGGSGDRLSGGGGADVFDFAGLTDNVVREATTILDYEIGVDALNLAASDVASASARGGRLMLQLEGGDHDMITIMGVDDVADLTFLL